MLLEEGSCRRNQSTTGLWKLQNTCIGWPMQSRLSCSAPGPAEDYRADSDLDILIVKEEFPSEQWLENLRDQARELQKSPVARGVGN